MKFLGELLVFVLLLIINLRIYYTKHEKVDSLVALSPVCVFLALLEVIAWGADPFTLLAVFISIVVFLSNFHAFFRIISRLYVDHYSPLMQVWAFFTNLLSLGGIVVLIIFAPVELDSRKNPVTETKYYYTGSFARGFSEAEMFSKRTAFLTEFTSPAAIPDPSTVIVLMPDKRGNTDYYSPYLKLLSQKGYRVVCADFYSKDLKWLHSAGDSRYTRRLFLVIASLMNKQKFENQSEFYTYNSSLECAALIPLLEERYGITTKFFFITDFMANDAVSDYSKKNSDKICGILNLDKLEEYHTPGYGMVEMTDPLLAAGLGFKKDYSGEQTKLLVEKSAEIINRTVWGED